MDATPNQAPPAGAAAKPLEKPGEKPDINELIKAAVGNLAAATTAAHQAAEQYARMAPAQKPSYVGILLVAGAVALEAVQAFTGRGISFSETIKAAMLIGGMLLITAGAVVEYFVMWSGMVEARRATDAARRQIETLGKEEAGWMKRILGS